MARTITGFSLRLLGTTLPAYAARTLVLAAVFRTIHSACRQEWRGTAPFCRGECPGGWVERERSKTGGGSRCLTGHKVLCEQCDPTPPPPPPPTTPVPSPASPPPNPPPPPPPPPPPQHIHITIQEPPRWLPRRRGCGGMMRSNRIFDQMQMLDVMEAMNARRRMAYDEIMHDRERLSSGIMQARDSQLTHPSFQISGESPRILRDSVTASRIPTKYLSRNSLISAEIGKAAFDLAEFQTMFDAVVSGAEHAGKNDKKMPGGEKAPIASLAKSRDLPVQQDVSTLELLAHDDGNKSTEVEYEAQLVDVVFDADDIILSASAVVAANPATPTRTTAVAPPVSSGEDVKKNRTSTSAKLRMKLSTRLPLARLAIMTNYSKDSVSASLARNVDLRQLVSPLFSDTSKRSC